MIKKLTEKVSNMIAAGEVVERPLSVVKELVENSIDAGSTYIQIDLKEAGVKEIKITDDGTGMNEEDSVLCFSRHATSKISSEHDLFNLHTLGFRGEALPSIASVSKVLLETSQGEEGYFVKVVAGSIVETGMSQAKKGTKIEVKNLFYNTPARLKFLKSLNYELSLISDFCTKIALSNPNIIFKLTNNNKVLISTDGSNNLLKAISKVYGIETAKSMLKFEVNNYDYQVDGYISNSTISRSNRNYINIILNNRIIKNFNINKSIIGSYGNKLFSGRFPIIILSIKCDPLLVDVNVHPSKMQVKLTDEFRLIKMIVERIKETLTNTVAIPIIPIKKSTDLTIDKIKDIPNLTEIENVAVNSKINYPSGFRKQTAMEDSKINYAAIDKIFDSSIDKRKMEKDSSIVSDEKSKNNIVKEGTNIYKIENIKEKKEEKIIVQNLFDDDHFPTLSYIGQFAKSYLLCESNLDLYIIDQHAALERVKYENFSKYLNEQNYGSFELLTPYNLEYSKEEFLIIKEKLDQLKKYKIVLVESGISSFYLREVPNWFESEKILTYTEEIIKSVLNGDINQVVDNLASLLACKRSVRANEYISKIEVETLLENLKKCANPYTCPHGRPVILKYTKNDIKRYFKR